jgi:hypothetical protein
MPATITLYLILVWFCVGFFTGLGCRGALARRQAAALNPSFAGRRFRCVPQQTGMVIRATSSLLIVHSMMAITSRRLLVV